MNNTAKQLVEQLGNSTEITIMSDIVHGLNFEYEQLQEENENLKQINEEHRKLNGELREENKKSNYILTEFEKWLETCLENEKYCYLSPHGEDRYRYNIFKEVLDKLQELKGSEK